MKTKTYLLLDVNNLAYRAFNTTKHLSYEDQPTGVIYGFLRNLHSLQTSFNTGRLVFCFDYGRSYREGLGVGYKTTRRTKEKAMPQEERLLKDEMRDQVDLLRKKYLPDLGFKNILYCSGYEADDVMASIVRKSLPFEDSRGKKRFHQAVMVTSDKDMYQCLPPNVTMYDPVKKSSYTLEKFLEEFKTIPKRWPMVKAIAGCKTDDIVGLKGVGEKTAIKFINGSLEGVTDKAKEVIRRIEEFTHSEEYKTNLLLAKLPYPETPTYVLRDDRCDRKAWMKLIDKLGMKSLEQEVPIFEE